MPVTEISTKSVEPAVFQVARQEFENVEEEDSVRGFSQVRSGLIECNVPLDKFNFRLASLPRVRC